jgi:hypothetical protein
MHLLRKSDGVLDFFRDDVRTQSPPKRLAESEKRYSHRGMRAYKWQNEASRGSAALDY